MGVRIYLTTVGKTVDERGWLSTLEANPRTRIVSYHSFRAEEAVVVEDDEGVRVGAATLTMHPSPEVLGVFVRPEKRGQGIGQKLFEAAVRRLTQRGAERIRCEVATEAGRALVLGLQKVKDGLHSSLEVLDFAPRGAPDGSENWDDPW